MQNYEKNAQKAKDFIKNLSNLSQFNRSVRVQNYVQQTQQRSYAERYEGLYFLSLGLAFVAQCASMWSSYAKVESFVKFKVTNPDALFAFVLACLLVVEVLKYFLVHTCLRDVFALRPIYPYPLLVCALLVSLFSTWLSVSGSTELAKDTKQEQAISAEQASKERELKSEIAKIRDTDTYKTIIWDGTGKTSKILNEAGKALVAKREAELDSLRKTYQRKTQQFEAVQASNVQTYNYVFGVFEVLFLVFTVGAHHYKRQCAIEAQIQPTQSNIVGTVNEVEALQTQVQQLATELQRALQQKPENKAETPLYSELHSPLQSVEVAESNTVGKAEEATNLEEGKAEHEVDTERLFKELLAKYSNGNATYLKKHQKTVEMILKLKIQNLPTAEICAKVCKKQGIGNSTFYGILRLINNTKTE
jgi:hypothetical protein